MDFEFGSYRVKRADRTLLGPQGPIELSARAFDILALLIEQPDQVISKSEIFDAVWPGLVVEENTLQVHVSALRKAVGAGMILTVHGRGYKYAGPMPVTTPALQDGAKQLGVQYLVGGSVRKTGNRIRISVQLIDASSAAQVWSERYDRELTDIFVIQDEITQMIAARLARQARIALAVQARARPTASISAYDLYLRALHLAASYDTVQEAEPYLRRAIEIDPQFASAHAMLSFVESIKYFWVYNHPAHLDAGLEIARTALQHDPDETYAHLASGFAFLYQRRFRLAEVSLNRAVALNPNDPLILSIRALLLAYTSRPAEALSEITKAQRRDPFAVGWYGDFRGIILTTAGLYRDAIACYAELENLTTWSLAHLTVCHAELGEEEKARDCLARLKASWPGLSIDEIISSEVDFFEDPAVCNRYRDRLRRIDDGSKA